MQEIDSIMIRRSGGENDPNAEVVLELKDTFGFWIEIGREKICDNFSHCWSLPFSGAKDLGHESEKICTQRE